MLMARANTAKEGGCPRSQQKRQSPRQPQDQHGQRCNQETGGKTEPKDPIRMQTIDSRSSRIETEGDDHAPVAQAGEDQ